MSAPLPPVSRLQAFLEIFLGVVQRQLGAVLLGEFQLLVRRGAGDHLQAHQLAELAGGQAGAAGGAEHRQRLARLRAGAIFQRMQRGAVDDDDAGGAIKVEIVGNLHDRRGRQRDLFASAVVAAGCHHAVADLQIGDAFADALDHAGDFGGRRERERRLDLILALDHQEVEEIQRRRLDGDHRLAGIGHRIGDIGQHEIVGTAILRAENGFHRTPDLRIETVVCFMPDLTAPDNRRLRDPRYRSRLSRIGRSGYGMRCEAGRGHLAVTIIWERGSVMVVRQIAIALGVVALTCGGSSLALAQAASKGAKASAKSEAKPSSHRIGRADADRPVRQLGRLYGHPERQEGLLRAGQAVVVEDQSAEPAARSGLCLHLHPPGRKSHQRSVGDDRLSG